MVHVALKIQGIIAKNIFIREIILYKWMIQFSVMKTVTEEHLVING